MLQYCGDEELATTLKGPREQTRREDQESRLRETSETSWDIDSTEQTKINSLTFRQSLQGWEQGAKTLPASFEGRDG